MMYQRCSTVWICTSNGTQYVDPSIGIYNTTVQHLGVVRLLIYTSCMQQNRCTQSTIKGQTSKDPYPQLVTVSPTTKQQTDTRCLIHLSSQRIWPCLIGHGKCGSVLCGYYSTNYTYAHHALDTKHLGVSTSRNDCADVDGVLDMMPYLPHSARRYNNSTMRAIHLYYRIEAQYRDAHTTSKSSTHL